MVQNKTFSAKALQTFVAVMFAVITCFGFMTTPTAEAASGFYVSGTSIYDANGNKFVMRGVNIAHAWYTEKTETSIKGAANNGANTVRVVLANGSKYTKTSAQEVKNIISWCKSNKLICILEVHDATGSDSTYDLNKCVDYWKEMKSVLSGTEKYVIVNIANEWCGTWNGSAWADGYKSAIQSVRNAGITNMLMVDCAGWGQYPDSIKDYGKSVFNADSQKNTVFSIHMYEYAGGNGYYTIYTGASNYKSCLDVYNWSSDNGANINQWQYHGGECQKFQLVKIGDAYAIKTKISDCYSCLDVYEQSTADGANINQWSYWGGKCQLWYLESTSGSSSSSSSSSSSGSNYKSIFWGSSTASAWGQAVSAMTSKNGGSFNAYDIQSNGYFYVEYSGTQDQVEFVLQSWSGGAEWAKVSPSETGTANGHYYAKYSYNNCKSAFGTSDFGGKLDQIHAGAANGTVTIYSVCYCW